MSFFKKLFESRKDSKYGKGYKLGDKSTQQEAQISQHSQAIPVSVNRPQTSNVQTEAARAAGQAALARLQNKNNPVKPVASYQSQVSKEQEKIREQENELQKALALKDHYFGQKNIKSLEAAPIVSKHQIRFTAPNLDPNESYPKNEIEDHIEQRLLVQLDEEPILVAVTLLFTANYKNKEKLDKCIEIMNKFVDNILNNPKEEKYRKIRLENPIFKEKVYSCKYADMVLKKSGFKAKSISKFEPSPNEPDVQIEVNEDFFVFEEDNLQNLEKLKEALSLGEPITAQLYRDLKVYRINLNSTSANNFDLGEEFYNLNIEEMRREQQLRNETLEKQGMLRTKAMRERDEQLELRRYNYCLIRVRFPNDYILQALFKATETYEDMYHFIQSNLEYDYLPFELFGHSLKKTTIGNSTLAEAGLAPAALLNFKWNEDSIVEASQLNINLKHYIKMELVERALNLE